MWASLAQPHPERDGRFTMRGVVGPDEFHTKYPDAETPGLSDDPYTNFMAAWILTCAVGALDRLAAIHRTAVMARRGLGSEELSHWSKVAAGLHLATDMDCLYLPFDRYDTRHSFDLEAYEKKHPVWFLEAQGVDINAFQVQKQATFAMLVHLLSLEELTGVLHKMAHPMSPENIQRMTEKYPARPSHNSSLSDLIYAGALSPLSPQASRGHLSGHPSPEREERPFRRLKRRPSRRNIRDPRHSSADLSRPAVVTGRPDRGPCPIPHLGCVRAHVLFRSNSVMVAPNPQRIIITADAGNQSAVPLMIHGHPHDLGPERPVSQI